MDFVLGQSVEGRSASSEGVKLGTGGQHGEVHESDMEARIVLRTESEPQELCTHRGCVCVCGGRGGGKRGETRVVRQER